MAFKFDFHSLDPPGVITPGQLTIEEQAPSCEQLRRDFFLFTKKLVSKHREHERAENTDECNVLVAKEIIFRTKAF